MPTPVPITVAHGDGIGPEIMAATLQILKEAGAALDIETIEIGEKVYLRGNTAGIEPSSWDSLRRTKVFLKAPITTPQGGGFKSLNVTTRKTLGPLRQRAALRLLSSRSSSTKHPGMDVVIVRENEEDLYAGIEYQATPDEIIALKLISRPGSEKIVRYAFEYALQHNRKKVTCFTKDNIMKMTDGLLPQDLRRDRRRISRHRKGTLDRRHRRRQDGRHARSLRRHRDAEPLRRHPLRRGRADRRFGRPRRIGQHRRRMRDVRSHPRLGAAPRRTEPGEPVGPAARRGADAGPHRPARSRPSASTTPGCAPSKTASTPTTSSTKASASRRSAPRNSRRPWSRASVRSRKPSRPPSIPRPRGRRVKLPEPKPAPKTELVGVDVYVEWPSREPNGLAAVIGKASGDGLTLEMIANRGVKVWPDGSPETFCTDNFRCRFLGSAESRTSRSFPCSIASSASGFESG